MFCSACQKDFDNPHVVLSEAELATFHMQPTNYQQASNEEAKAIPLASYDHHSSFQDLTDAAEYCQICEILMMYYTHQDGATTSSSFSLSYMVSRIEPFDVEVRDMHRVHMDSDVESNARFELTLRENGSIDLRRSGIVLVPRGEHLNNQPMLRI